MLSRCGNMPSSAWENFQLPIIILIVSNGFKRFFHQQSRRSRIKIKNNRYKISLIKLPLYKSLVKYIAFKIFTESLLCLITFLTSLLLIYGVEVNIFVKSFSLPWYNNHFWTILIDTVLKQNFTLKALCDCTSSPRWKGWTHTSKSLKYWQRPNISFTK